MATRPIESIESFDPSRPDIVKDPYPAYSWLRAHDPVHFSRYLDGWVLTRYDDVQAVLRDGDRFSSEMLDTSVVANLFNSDGAQHTKYRRAVTSALAGVGMNSLGPKVEGLAEELVDAVVGQGRVDVVDALANRLPLTIVGDMLGLPRERIGDLRRWTRAVIDGMSLLGGYDFVMDGQTVGGYFELITYFLDVVNERRAHPAGDVLSLMAANQADVLSDYEIVQAGLSVLVAGHVNADNLIARGVYELAEKPELWRRLQRRPDLVRNFVEEMARWEAPLQVLARRATEDVEIGGVPVKAGDKVFAYIGAANRDPARFPDPDFFDLHRVPTGYLSFGTGPHACMGGPLAVMEVSSAIRFLLERADTVHVDWARKPKPNWWRGMRGFEELPVVVVPKGARSVTRTMALAATKGMKVLSPNLRITTVTRSRRNASLAAFSTRRAVDAMATKLRTAVATSRGKQAINEEFHARTAREMLELFGGMKGAVMKIGQMVSFLDTGLPDVYRELLSSLQDNAAPLDTPRIVGTIEAELGPVGRVFADFDDTPLAAASIGQVHRAKLADGTEVAVKVQYPGIADAIKADLDNLELMTLVVGTLSSVVGMELDAASVAREIRQRVSDELDYPAEARSQQLFADLYADDPVIHVPNVVPELCSKHVITSELVHGLRWAEAQQAPQDVRDKWGEAIYRFVFGSLYRHCVFNGDPHPGNYLFHEDGSVTFLDFGCIQRFEPVDVDRLKGMTRAVLDRDPDGLLDRLVELGYFAKADGHNAQRIYDWLGYVYVPLQEDAPFTYTSAYARELFRRQFEPDPDWADILKTVNVPRNLTFLNRINFGLPSILSGLNATANWRAIIDELLFAEPSPAVVAGDDVGVVLTSSADAPAPAQPDPA